MMKGKNKRGIWLQYVCVKVGIYDKKVGVVLWVVIFLSIKEVRFQEKETTHHIKKDKGENILRVKVHVFEMLTLLNKYTF